MRRGSKNGVKLPLSLYHFFPPRPRQSHYGRAKREAKCNRGTHPARLIAGHAAGARGGNLKRAARPGGNAATVGARFAVGIPTATAGAECITDVRCRNYGAVADDHRCALDVLHGCAAGSALGEAL